MPTRTVTIQLIQQTPAREKVMFIPQLTAVEDGVVLEKNYTCETDETGYGEIELPAPVTYKYITPRSNGNSIGTKQAVFHLAAGGPISLGEAISAGAPLTQSYETYVNNMISAVSQNFNGEIDNYFDQPRSIELKNASASFEEYFHQAWMDTTPPNEPVFPIDSVMKWRIGLILDGVDYGAVEIEADYEEFKIAHLRIALAFAEDLADFAGRVFLKINRSTDGGTTWKYLETVEFEQTSEDYYFDYFDDNSIIGTAVAAPADFDRRGRIILDGTDILSLLNQTASIANSANNSANNAQNTANIANNTANSAGLTAMFPSASNLATLTKNAHVLIISGVTNLLNITNSGAQVGVRLSVRMENGKSLRINGNGITFVEGASAFQGGTNFAQYACTSPGFLELIKANSNSWSVLIKTGNYTFTAG